MMPLLSLTSQVSTLQDGLPSDYLWLLSGLASLAGLFFAARIGAMKLIRRWKGIASSSKGSHLSVTSTSTWTNKPKAGDSRIAPIWVITLCCASLIIIPTSIALAKYFARYPIYTLTGVQVISETSGGYWMEYRSEAMGKLSFFARMCEKPPFDPGDYLKVLRYQDRGTCWSLNSEHAGVIMRRDAEGRTDSERQRQTTQKQ